VILLETVVVAGLAYYTLRSVLEVRVRETPFTILLRGICKTTSETARTIRAIRAELRREEMTAVTGHGADPEEQPSTTMNSPTPAHKARRA